MKPEFKEFIELLDFLNKIDNGEDIYLKLGRFFPKLSAEEEIELVYIYEEKDEGKYDEFMKNEIFYDPEGRSKPEPRHHWQIVLKLIEQLYDSVKDNPTERELQVIHAKTLEPLYSVSGETSYTMSRAVFLKKFPEQMNKILDIEQNITDLELPDEFMRRFGRYLSTMRKVSDFDVFVSNIKTRLYILKADKDLMNPVNEEFKETILAVSNYIEGSDEDGTV